ncbi:protein translocase subunit SecF [Moraxella sp. VT-16-12]|uniref:protein translocase subunit SecF n=1 Tax=Moraxella sp. VT-16-12 TaxID=2014877 RepID=UPI000B7C84B3|nr:protein translocase subunit SecF [Moraxella sp. VT-16-12]TWV81977.1 protein translocase subunit SecF [Moraxella sp. VT-16-12]
MTENNPIDPTDDGKTTPRRRAPRRNGKGSNAAANAKLDGQAIVSNNDTDDIAEKEGGIKLIGNQRIIPFMKLEIPMMVISTLLVIASVIALSVKGLNLGLDFTGGVSADVKYSQPVEQASVTRALADKGFNDAVVQYLGTRDELLVRLPPQDGKDASTLNQALTEALNLPQNSATVENINVIGSQLGNEIYLNSLMALGVALVLMMIYVAVRFQFKLAVGAVLSLFHDVIVVCGLFAIFGWPFDLTVLASVLALIGYSVNDTIVVYDRIRENFRRVRGLTPRQVVDLSLTETLRRTFMTSGTVFVVVIAMLFLGGEGLFWFALAQFIGTIAGTYSSVYIASSIPLRMGLSREDFVVKVKPEFTEEVVVFADPNLQNAKD